MRFLAIEEKINGLSYLFVVDLSVQVFVNHLRTLFGCDITEQVGAQIARNGYVIGRPGITRSVASCSCGKTPR